MSSPRYFFSPLALVRSKERKISGDTGFPPIDLASILSEFPNARKLEILLVAPCLDIQAVVFKTKQFCALSGLFKLDSFNRLNEVEKKIQSIKTGNISGIL